MRYGNCAYFKDADKIKILKNIGFDYIETGLASLNDATETEIAEFVALLGENNIKCEAVNVLFPGGISLTGENADFSKAAEYIAAIFEKTKNIGFKTVVFGSGGARKVPENFPKEKALEQIKKVICDFLIPAAEKYDFTVALEELNRNETNIINTIEEAEDLIAQVNHPRIKLVADLYHIAVEDANGVKKLSGMGDIIAHCHIANPYNNRYYPGVSDSEKSKDLYKAFFAALKSSGYDGKISIEGNIADEKNFYEESKTSLEFMKSINNK